jgi:hypothetical protein
MKYAIFICLVSLNFACKHSIHGNLKSDNNKAETSVAEKISDSLLPSSNPYCIFIQQDSNLGYIDIRPFDIEGGKCIRNYYRNVKKYEQMGIYAPPINWSDSNPGAPVLKRYQVNGIDYRIYLDITEKESNLTVCVNNHKKIQCYLGEAYSRDYWVDEVLIYTDDKSFEIIGNFEDKRIYVGYPYNKVMDTTLIDDQFLLVNYYKTK